MQSTQLNTKPIKSTPTSSVLERGSDMLSSLNDGAHSIADRSVGVVKKYPLYSLIGAAAVGFAAASLLRMRK